jgi:hypothetical protein
MELLVNRLNAAQEEIKQNQVEIARYRSAGGAAVGGGYSSGVGHVSTITYFL